MKINDMDTRGSKISFLRIGLNNPQKNFQWILVLLFFCTTSRIFSQVGPYTADANTVLLDHFDGSTSASILAFSENGTTCTQQPSATPIYSYGAGPAGFNQALSVSPPVGQPTGSATYLQYPNGQVLSVPNGSIEFYIYLTAYGSGNISLAEQGQYYHSCGGWTFGMFVDTSGQVIAEAWAAFNMNSGTSKIQLNTWTHVAATWGSTGAKLYINGTLVGSDANTGMPASGYGGALMMELGTHAGVTTWIDELRVSDIQRTYTASLPAPTLRYPLDGATGVAPTDSVRWNPVAGATSYYIQIGTSSDLNAGYIVNETVYGTAHWVGPTTPGEQLYWHVSASNGTVSSSYSTIWGFTAGSGTTNDPVAYYPFNGNAYDESGNGHNGTNNGATLTTDRFGYANSAFNFDGIYSYISIADPVPSNLQIQNEITLSAWIYITGYPSELGMIVGSQNDATYSGASIFIDGRENSDGQTSPVGHIHFQIGNGSWHESNANAVVPLNQWILVTATRKSNEDAKIYYNGVLQPLTSVSWDGSITYTSAWFAIGRQKDLGRLFAGTIDDIRIYNRALSESEIQLLFNEGGWNPNYAPAAPQNLLAFPGNGQVTLKWNKNTESDILRYRIYRNTIPSSPIVVDSVDQSPVDTLRIMSGLTNGTPYYFSITAVNAVGFESGHSVEVMTTPNAVADVTPPGSPINPTTPGGWISRTVSLSWTNPTDSSGIAELWYTFDSPPSISNLGTPISVAGATTENIPTPSYSSSGTYTLYFYLADGAGNKDYTTAVSVTFQCDKQSPVINGVNVMNTPVYLNNSGILTSSSPQINSTATDVGSGIQEMRVVYRSTGETAWTYSSYSYGSSINFILPQTPNKFSYNGKPVGVNFRVEAIDNAGNEIWSDYNSIDVRLDPQVTDQPNFTMPAASQTNNKTTAYRMISVPYDLGIGNQQPYKILGNFGPHTDNNISYARWRFQRYINGQYQDYEQFSNENAVTPGAAFFFIVRDQDAQIIVQGATIVRSDSMYSQGIQLQSGWNLVGDPFTLPYPIDSLIFSSGAIRQRAYYSGVGSIGGWDTSSTLVQSIQPWQGVALYVNNPGILRFPSLGMRGLPKVNSLASTPVLKQKSAENWTLAVNAYRADIDMRCEGTGFGMAKEAGEGYDRYDSYLPPIVGDKNVAVYFKNADDAMMRDIRPLNENGDMWDMRVVTGDAGASVKLQFGSAMNLPNPAFEVYLIDLDQKIAHNLKEIQSLDINSGTGVRNFRVAVGKKAYIEQNNAGVELSPTVMALYANYPNPFNPETVIRYTVPNASASYRVTLKVFNMLGQEIVTLVNEQKQSGYYEVKWNAAQQSSGVYFYQLSVSDGVKTVRDIKKMILMK